MPSLTTLVADFADRVERATVRCSAVARNMALLQSVTKPRDENVRGETNEFATSIAFHSLGLAVPGIVIRAAAFVARCWAGASSTT